MTTDAKPKAETFQAGDTVVWTHYSDTAGPAERIGTVWSGAPTGNGLSNAWWVHPDEPLPGEVLAGGVLAVGRSSRTNYQTGRPEKGELYGSSRWQDQPGSLTEAAACGQATHATKWASDRRAMGLAA